MAHDNFPQGVSSARYSSSQLSPRAFLASVTSLVFVMYLQHEKVSNTFWNIILNKKPHVLVSWVWGYKLNNKVFDCFLSLFIVYFLLAWELNCWHCLPHLVLSGSEGDNEEASFSLQTLWPASWEADNSWRGSTHSVWRSFMGVGEGRRKEGEMGEEGG